MARIAILGVPARAWRVGVYAALCLLVLSCGGGSGGAGVSSTAPAGSTPTGANVANIVKDVIPSDLFAILLYSELQRGLSIRYSIGHREEVVRSLIIPLNEGITGTAAATRLPLLVNDVRSDPRYLNALDAVRAEIAVPMLARDKLVGVIDVQSTNLNAYREQDRSPLPLVLAGLWRSFAGPERPTGGQPDGR